MSNAIPKKINYVWVGGAPEPDSVKLCIESWKKYLPDCEIIRWDESNFDMNICPYLAEAYAAKKWAFVSDVMRTYILYNYGGIYFDTDLELIKTPDILFGNNIVLGYETKYRLATCCMTAVPETEIFGTLLKQYETEHFTEDGVLNQKTINHRLSEIVFEYIGKKYLPDGNYSFDTIDLFNKLVFSSTEVNEVSVAVHHFMGSWKTQIELTRWQYFWYRVKLKLARGFIKSIGNIKYINYDEKCWRKARDITTPKNKRKNKKIYVVL
ncbi:MAG: glycosyl transferase [Clostridia bacterium]|nr:glycosyl transferase [Clostridia bacterium]